MLQSLLESVLTRGSTVIHTMTKRIYFNLTALREAHRGKSGQEPGARADVEAMEECGLLVVVAPPSPVQDNQPSGPTHNGLGPPVPIIN